MTKVSARAQEGSWDEDRHVAEDDVFELGTIDSCRVCSANDLILALHHCDGKDVPPPKKVRRRVNCGEPAWSHLEMKHREYSIAAPRRVELQIQLPSCSFVVVV